MIEQTYFNINNQNLFLRQVSISKIRTYAKTLMNISQNKLSQLKF